MITSDIVNVYIKLIDEDIDVWKPVEARLIKDYIFEILDKNDEYGERWEFNFGDIVECELRNGDYFAISKIKQ